MICFLAAHNFVRVHAWCTCIIIVCEKLVTSATQLLGRSVLAAISNVWLAGVHVIVNASSGPAGLDSISTALILIIGTSLVIQDLVFEGLRISQDTLLILANSTALVRNTSFIDNQAASYSGMQAAGMMQLIISTSTFRSNTGMNSAD